MAKTPSSNHSNQNRRPQPSGPKGPMSKESKFIGYLVLGFGVLAVITVLILAFGGHKKETVIAEPVNQVRKLAPELRPAVAPPKKEVKEELLFKRTPDFNAARMDGEWQSQIGQYTAVMQIDKNVFQVILASENEQMPRLYSSGTFKVLEDIVMLAPQMGWPKPTSASKDIQYRKLTSANYAVIAYFDGEDMVWQNPPQTEKRVLAPRRSPLLMSQDQDAILWKRLKKK